MYKEIKNLLYPAILVTHIDLFKVTILPDPPKSEHQLDILLGKPQPQPMAVWQLAKNLVWTFNAYGVKAMLKEKPIDALKLLNKAMQVLEIKQTGVDWTDRDEYKVLKLAILRNLVYFYFKHDDYRIATKFLKQIDKIQQTLDPVIQDSIDLATPYLLMLYNYFMEGKVEETLQISKVLTFLCKDYLIDCSPGVDYLEPTLNPKRNEIHRMMNSFIQAKCYFMKQDYKTAVEKYKPGIKLLESVIFYFGEEFKGFILKQFLEAKQRYTEVENARAESERRRQIEREKIEAANREKLGFEIKLEYQKIEKLRPMTAQTYIRPIDIQPTQSIPVPERLSDAHDPEQMKLALKHILRKSKTGSLAVSESNATLAELDQLNRQDSINPSIAGGVGSRELLDLKKQSSVKKFIDMKAPLITVDSLIVPSLENVSNKAGGTTLVRIPSRPTNSIKEKDKDKEKSSNDKSKSSKKSAFAEEAESSKNSSMRIDPKTGMSNIVVLNTPSRLRKSKSAIKSQASTMQELEFFKLAPSIPYMNNPQTEKNLPRTANDFIADPRLTDPTPSPELPSPSNLKLRIPTIETNNFFNLMNNRPGQKTALPSLQASRIPSGITGPIKATPQAADFKGVDFMALPKAPPGGSKSSSNRSFEVYNSLLLKAIDGVETIEERSDTNELREMIELIDMPSRRPSIMTNGSSSSDVTQPQAISVSSISSHKSIKLPSNQNMSPGLRSPASRQSISKSPKSKRPTFLQLRSPKNLMEKSSPRSPNKLTSPHEVSPMLNDGSNTNKNLLLPISFMKQTPSSRLSSAKQNAISFAQMITSGGHKSQTPTPSDKSSTDQIDLGNLGYLRQIEDRAANLIKVQILLYNLRKARRVLESTSPPTTIMGQTPTPTPTPSHAVNKDPAEAIKEEVATPKGEDPNKPSQSELPQSQGEISNAPASTIQLIKDHVSKDEVHHGTKTPTSLNDSIISNSVPGSVPHFDDTPGPGGKTPKGGSDTPKSWQRKNSNSPGLTRLGSNQSGLGLVEKEPMYKIEQRPKDFEGLMMQTLKFMKMFFLHVHHWKLKSYFKSGIKNIEFMILELRASQGLWIHFEMPFKSDGIDKYNDDDKDFVTNWPIVWPNFLAWFEKEGMGPSFLKYQTTNLQDYSTKMIKYRGDHKSPKKGGKHKEDKELQPRDIEAMLEIHKRLLYMIDKRLIIITKLTGRYLAKITSDEIEEMKIITIREKLLKSEDINLKRLQWNPDASIMPSEREYILRRYGEDREFQTLTEGESHRSQGIESNRPRILNINSSRRRKGIRTIRFTENSVSSKAQRKLFLSVARIGTSYFLVEANLKLNERENNFDDKNLSAHDYNILFTVNRIYPASLKRSNLILEAEEFRTRCIQYLDVKRGYFSSPNSFTWQARREIMRRMNKIITADEDDQPRFTNKFLNRIQTDEPNEKIRVHFLHASSKAFPTAFLDKQVERLTENDYLFEKNFKEIYEKNFLNQAYKVQDKSFDGDKSTNDSELLNESTTEIEYHGEVIEEDEAIFNSKPVSERDGKSELISFNGTFNDVKLVKYFQFLHEGSSCYMKLVFQNDFQNKSYINVSYYHPARALINYLDISDPRMISKINNIMTLNEDFTISALRSLFKYVISHPGRMLTTFHSSYDLSLIQQKNAFSLHPTYLKMDIMMQSDNLKAGFHSSTYYFMQSCANLGVCYIKMTVYKLKNTKMLDHNIDPSIYHFAMEVTPSKTRTKQYRVIFNTVDLSHLFNIPSINNDARSFMKIGRMILTHLLIFRNMIAKIMVLPPLKTRPEKPEALELLLYNNSFNVNAFENKAKFLNYFEPMQYGPKILYQGIRKFKRNYYNITVEYIYKFDYWNIILYHPKTSRSFLAPIHFDDILNLSSAFLYKAYPDFLHKAKMQGHSSYEEFQYVYSAFQNRMPAEPPESPSRGLYENTNPNLIDKAGKGLMAKTEKVYTIPCLYNNRYVDARFEPPNFHEFKFWDNMIKNLELFKDDDDNVFIKIDRYQNRLLEILHKSPIQLDRYTHGLIEIDIATTKRKVSKERNPWDNSFVTRENSMQQGGLNVSLNANDRVEFFTNFSNISYLSSINSLLNIRIFFSSARYCQHERLNLREIINLYIADGLYKYQANYIDSRMNLADLQSICDYIVHKIKNSNLIDFQNENSAPRKLSYVERPDYKFKMRLATQISGEDNPNDREGVFLCKKVLHSKPYILLSLHYDKVREIVNATLYRPKDSQQQVKEFKMEDILANIPTFEDMIENNQYKAAGKAFLEQYEVYLENYGVYCLDALARVKKAMEWKF